jgi:membrane protease YdiL (CAAX protease family)
MKGKSTMNTKTLIPFFGLTFGLTWGIVALLILFADQLTAIFGEADLSNPLILVAVYAPGIVGVILVGWYYRLKGLGSFFRRLTLWRMPLSWWLFLVLGIPVIFYIGAAIKGTIRDPLPFSSLSQALPALLIALFTIGTMEEFGWRGVALPLIQRKLSPFWAGILLGVAWALWHVPAFFLSGMPQSAWSAGPYFLGIIALSVILTPMFNSARGSLLIAYLYHFQVMNPLWPDAQPWDSFLFALVAVVIVILNRRTMFKKGSRVTEVLMPEREGEITYEADETAKDSLSATAG